MSDERNQQQRNMPGNPKEAEPGKGAPGSQWAVQTAQTVGVNAPDEEIPSGADVEHNREQLEAYEKQEEGTGMKTTDGYVIDDAGRINNFAVEPPMYVEGEDKK